MDSKRIINYSSYCSIQIEIIRNSILIKIHSLIYEDHESHLNLKQMLNISYSYFKAFFQSC